MNKDFTRRNLLKFMGAGAGVVLMGNLSMVEAALLPKPKKSFSADVIVIGTGLAGMCAALQAAEMGAKVIVLEKLPEELTGGSTKFSGGSIGVASADTKEAKDKFFEQISSRSLGKGNKLVMRVIADESLYAAKWIESYGAKTPGPVFRPDLQASSVIFEPGMYKNMPGVLKLLREAFVKKGGKFYYDTKARQLIMDDKAAVIGVRAEMTQGLVDFNGKVVLATGGYANNKEMLEKYVGPDADEAWYRGSALNVGDGHLMAKEAGAALVRMGGTNSLVLGMVSPENPRAGNPSYILHFGLCINQKGLRYTDEGLGYGFACPALLNEPGQKASLIFDEDIKNAKTSVANMVKQYDTNNIPYIKAETLEEAAEKMGVPKEAFLKTIKEYNAAVKDGKTEGVTPEKSKNAFKIEKAPFYVFSPLVPGITLTFGGIDINENAEALQPDGKVIKGLYACGECGGGVFHYEYLPVGLPCANAATMGRVAGRNAAKKA